MILYRPAGLQEMELIYDSGMKAFPARLSQQPIFYPVLDLEYARKIASDWNAKSGQFAGYVTQFKVEGEYISQFEEHTIGGTNHQEFWIPAEELEEFNRHIVGHIKVVEAHFGAAFQGFVPEDFGLQAKNAVAQFTVLANSYLYKRMDFYLEIKRNHKAVFLNYPFWQQHEFKNQGLKEKILQAIKEAWLTSFPKTPLPIPPPVHENAPITKQTGSKPVAYPVHEDVMPAEQTDSYSLANSKDEDTPSVEPTDTRSLTHSDHDEITAAIVMNPVHEDISLPKQTETHFLQGIKLGLIGKYQEAVAELSKAVGEDPNHAVAYTSLGVAFHRLGEDDRALSCYESAIRINSTSAEAHYFRANILYSRGNVREAITSYTIAMGLEPELIDAHQKADPQDRLTDYTRYPNEMYSIAKPTRRILDLSQSIGTNPRQAHLFKERAAEYSRLQNYEQAIADYSSFLALQPDDANTIHLRGLAYEQMGQHDRALEDYQRANAIDPDLSNIYINRGITFGKMGNFRQSIASLTEAIRLASDNPDGYFNRGIVFFQQGHFEKAIEDFSNVIRLSPKDGEAYYWRGISHEAAGHQREAIADYTQFLKISESPRAREEIEQKLHQWGEGKRNGVSNQSPLSDDKDQGPLESSDQVDLYDLIIALGQRALNSTWFGSGVDCYGETAKELYAFTDRNRPIQGNDLLRITSGIRQTRQGDFQAFDPNAASPWVFIRAWEGNGFYIETNDPKIKEHLKSHFRSIEEVEGVRPPYEGLFIHI